MPIVVPSFRERRVPELEDAAFNDLDAVIVASTTSTHAEVAKYALSNGALCCWKSQPLPIWTTGQSY